MAGTLLSRGIRAAVPIPGSRRFPVFDMLRRLIRIHLRSFCAAVVMPGCSAAMLHDCRIAACASMTCARMLLPGSDDCPAFLYGLLREGCAVQ